MFQMIQFEFIIERAAMKVNEWHMLVEESKFGVVK